MIKGSVNIAVIFKKRNEREIKREKVQMKPSSSVLKVKDNGPKSQLASRFFTMSSA